MLVSGIQQKLICAHIHICICIMLAGTISRGRMSYQKWLLLVFISPELFPVFHCCFQRLPKIIKWWVWIRILSNTVPCTETRSIWDFVCISRVESLFPTGLQVSCIEALLAFKARYSASCVPGAGAWGLGSPIHSSNPPSFWWQSLNYYYLPVCLLVTCLGCGS